MLSCSWCRLSLKRCCFGTVSHTAMAFRLFDGDLEVAGRVTKRLQDQLDDALCAAGALVSFEPQASGSDGNRVDQAIG